MVCPHTGWHRSTQEPGEAPSSCITASNATIGVLQPLLLSGCPSASYRLLGRNNNFGPTPAAGHGIATAPRLYARHSSTFLRRKRDASRRAVRRAWTCDSGLWMNSLVIRSNSAHATQL